MIELKLKKYTTKEILNSYEFIFSQYMGGELTDPAIKDTMPTVYIFKKICVELRKQYLLRKDAKIKNIIKVENGIVVRLAQLMNVPESKLQEIYDKMLIQVKNKIKTTSYLT